MTIRDSETSSSSDDSGRSASRPLSARPPYPKVEFYEERARWYREGCDGLEDAQEYATSGDLAKDAAGDLLALCSRVRDLEAAVALREPPPPHQPIDFARLVDELKKLPIYVATRYNGIGAPHTNHGLAFKREEVKALIDKLEAEVAAPSAVGAPPQVNNRESAMDDINYLDMGSNPVVGHAFHWRDGYTFQRTKLGAVMLGLPGGAVKVIPPNEWASIVASVSSAGETGETWAAALAFHGGA